MPREDLRIEACLLGGPLDDARDRAIAETLGCETAVAVQPAEDGSLGDLGGLEPGVERADGAEGGVRGVGDALLGAAALLVALGAPDGDDEALTLPLHVLDRERDKLGATEGAKPPHGEQRAIAQAPEARAERRD